MSAQQLLSTGATQAEIQFQEGSLFAHLALFEEFQTTPDERSLKHCYHRKLAGALVHLSDHYQVLTLLVLYHHSSLVYQIVVSHQ